MYGINPIDLIENIAIQDFVEIWVVRLGKFVWEHGPWPQPGREDKKPEL